MFHTETRYLSTELVSKPSASATHDADDGFDFPPTAHPGRELFTATLFVLLILALAIFGGWKLIHLIVSLT